MSEYRAARIFGRYMSKGYVRGGEACDIHKLHYHPSRKKFKNLNDRISESHGTHVTTLRQLIPTFGKFLRDMLKFCEIRNFSYFFRNKLKSKIKKRSLLTRTLKFKNFHKDISERFFFTMGASLQI